MSWTLEHELGGRQAQAEVSGIARRIRSSRRILLTTHVHPDGDAVGSELALALGL